MLYLKSRRASIYWRVLDSVHEGLLSYILPKDATISVVLTKAAECSKAVCAPTFGKRGVPKVCTLHAVQVGKERRVLRWQSQEVKPSPVGRHATKNSWQMRSGKESRRISKDLNNVVILPMPIMFNLILLMKEP